jgi:hypothetical protein
LRQLHVCCDEGLWRYILRDCVSSKNIVFAVKERWKHDQKYEIEKKIMTIACVLQPPRAHRGWQLIQAVDFGPACPQPVRYTGNTKGVRDMDEDCLYLNVYSPSVQ